MRTMWLRKRKSSSWFHLPKSFLVSEKEFMLTLRFLSHNVRSNQKFETLGKKHNTPGTLWLITRAWKATTLGFGSVLFFFFFLFLFLFFFSLHVMIFPACVANMHNCTEGFKSFSRVNHVTWVTFACSLVTFRGKLQGTLKDVLNTNLWFFFIVFLQEMLRWVIFKGFSDHISNPTLFDKCFLSQTLSKNIRWTIMLSHFGIN